MFLQVAVDCTEEADLISGLQELSRIGVRRVEIGTPTLVSIGCRALSIAGEYGFEYIYADAKCIDFAVATLSSMLFAAPIDGISCHACASDEELGNLLDHASSSGVEVFVSMLGLEADAIGRRIRTVPQDRGMAGIIAHGRGDLDAAFVEAVTAVQVLQHGLRSSSIVLAGGITAERLRSIEPALMASVSGIIVGRGIMASPLGIERSYRALNEESVRISKRCRRE
ncbi:orotidine 5'-phosphate decarboxylase / HUMPS family protein [Nocardia vulneris]|uniref:orotidine 5'-phosphate decarboxylase / HUMPS family protein n=1 Tax=Nocardia vulneris TaxID=1141657 RepID=UPI0030CF847D